jgi:protein SHQ1
MRFDAQAARHSDGGPLRADAAPDPRKTKGQAAPPRWWGAPRPRRLRMITPRFELSQDVDFVHVHISMPHLRAEDGEFYVDGHEFKFYLRPYFLRLTFQQRLVEDGREGASYDAGSGLLSVRLPKEVPGEPFTGLSMLSELLRKPSGAGGPGALRGPMIEVLSSSPNGGAAEEEEDEADDMWTGVTVDPNELLAMEAEADQSVSVPVEPRVRYGFNDGFCALFTGLEYEGLLQLPDPETASRAGRRLARQRAEAEAFDPEHYMADWMESREHAAVGEDFVPWWGQPEAQAWREEDGWSAGGAACGGAACGSSAVSSNVGWSDEERDLLHRLPRREMLLSRAESGLALCGLADVLFGYCYDVRTTDGEHNCESGWTVRVLSSQLSWLDPPLSPADAAKNSVRRALCYPLVRHWGLAVAALGDVVALLRLGRRAVLRALLKVRGCGDGNGGGGWVCSPK